MRLSSRAGGDKKLQMTGGGKEGAHHTTTVYNVKFISYSVHNLSFKKSYK